MNRDELRQVALEYYLETIGCEPQYVKGQDLWYLSPLRAEQIPSFKVNRDLNLWYDFGVGRGGDIFNFAEEYYHIHDDFPGVVAQLSQTLGDPVQIRWNRVDASTQRSRRLIITYVSDEMHRALRCYLISRGITDPGIQSICKTVYYRVQERNYFALGFKNDSGGYELRNRYFKGSSSPKDITTIHEDDAPSTCCVFEGFMDYLSFLTIGRYDIGRSDCIVLNSLVHAVKVLPVLKQYRTVFSFLDSDTAGKDAFSFLCGNLSDARDMSQSYGRCKDLNEFLCTSL